MKLIYFLLFVSPILFTQSNVLFIPLHEIKDSTEEKKTFKEFEKDYQPAGSFLNGDSISNAWFNSFYPKLKKIVSDSMSVIDKETKLWIDLGCTPNGKIEKIIYFSNDLYTQNLDKRFQFLLTQFLENYSFPLKSEKRYSQCGSFRFQPTKKDSLK